MLESKGRKELVVRFFLDKCDEVQFVVENEDGTPNNEDVDLKGKLLTSKEVKSFSALSIEGSRCIVLCTPFGCRCRRV